MAFAENLKQIRKEKGLSQEELAELLDVSRQAVSKWEQGLGYPEVEKLLYLSHTLHISLDSLMAAEIAGEPPAGNFADSTKITGQVLITAPHENVIANCYKVLSTQKLRARKGSPQFALFGVGMGGTSFWGEPTTFLGWYADDEQISKEISGIQQAIAQGIPTYTLQYSVKVERHWLRMKILHE